MDVVRANQSGMVPTKILTGLAHRGHLMKTRRQASAKPIHLKFRSVQEVVVEPSDKDRFVMTSKEAAHACKRADEEKEWREDFEQFLMDVRQWCDQHADQVEKGYVGVGDGMLNIFVLTKKKTYDFSLDDELSDFDIWLAQKFPWLVADVMQLPKNIQENQITSGKAILVYGD